MYNCICFLPTSSRSVGLEDIVGMYTVLLLGLLVLLLGLQLSMFTINERFIPRMMRMTLINTTVYLHLSPLLQHTESSL